MSFYRDRLYPMITGSYFHHQRADVGLLINVLPRIITDALSVCHIHSSTLVTMPTLVLTAFYDIIVYYTRFKRSSAGPLAACRCRDIAVAAARLPPEGRAPLPAGLGHCTLM